MKSTTEMIGKEIKVEQINGEDNTTGKLIVIEDFGILLESEEEYEDDEGNEKTETVTWYVPFRNVSRIQHSPNGCYEE